MEKLNLNNIGLNERIINESTMYSADLYIGRVSVQQKDIYKVITEQGEINAEVSGKFKHEATGTESFPAVGDWVLLDRLSNTNGNGIIHHVLTRKSTFERKVAGQRRDIQIVAANIDILFICMALNNDFNVRRLERYLSVAWDSMATPIIILTKSDLCDNIIEKQLEVESVAIGVDIVIVNSITGEGHNVIRNYINNTKTVAFIGSSGVGKSTLVNSLVGSEVLETNGLRNDDRGRHTTTHRQLIMLPCGGVVIDTPGMRELQLSSGNVEKSFSDIEDLALQCKFNDCKHESEPGCAVKKAIADGTLDSKRLESYKKIQKELKYSNLNSRTLEKEKVNDMFASVGGIKNAKKFAKEKNKRRYK